MTQPILPTLPTLHNVDHLSARHVAELVQNAAWPAVTVLLDTTPADRMTLEDRSRLSRLVDDAERQLVARGAHGATRIVSALRTLAHEAGQSPTARGLVVLASLGVQRTYRLPGAVAPTAVVERTFRTRELLQTLHRTPPHLLLMVEPLCAQLYRVYADTLTPLVEDGFPLQFASPVRGALEAGDDRLEGRMIQLDRMLGRARRRHPSPIIVAGDHDQVHAVLRRSRHLGRLAGVLTGPEVSSPSRLYLAAKASLEEYLRARQDEAILLLQERTSERPETVHSGVECVWQRMEGQDRPLMLLVEEGFSFPAVVDERGVRRVDWLRAPEAVPAGLHTDLVDDLIEIVIDRGGWVAFAADGALRKHQRIALVTRQG